MPPESEWNSVIETLPADHPLCLMLQRISAMKKNGAIVAAFSADIGEQASLANAVQAIEKKMGKITGIVHAAGETVNGIISLKTACSLDESYQAKVFGTYNLYSVFKQYTLDFLILSIL